MVTGAPFQAGVPVSASELNKKTVTFSDDIVNQTALPGQLFVATANQCSWLTNDLVMRKISDDGWVTQSQNRHLHNADTNAAGGLLSDVYRSNMGQFILFSKLLGLTGADLGSYGSATATVGLDITTGAVKLDTIATAGNYLVSKLTGVSPSLSKASTLQSVMQFHGNATNLFVRWGMNMEPMDLSNNNAVKYGIESCTASNGNWNLVTSDGTTRTAMDSLTSLEGTTAVPTRRGHVLNFIPGSALNYYYQNNAVVSKSTQLPPSTSATGTIPFDNVINFGLKTSDANAKQLYIWGLAVVAGVDDLAWKQRF